VGVHPCDWPTMSVSGRRLKCCNYIQSSGHNKKLPGNLGVLTAAFLHALREAPTPG